MIKQFVPHLVKIKENLENKEFENWDISMNYPVLSMEINKSFIDNEQEVKTDQPHKDAKEGMIEYDPNDDDLEEDEQGFAIERHKFTVTEIWLLIGNMSNGEYKWIEITDVKFAGLI